MDAEQAKKVLADVLSILDEKKVPADVRPVAFEQLWRSLSAAEPRAEPSAERTAPGGPAGQPIDRLAQSLDADAATLVDFYQLQEDGALQPVVPTRLLSKSKATATKELGLLVCAGRQATGEESTPAAAIREVCKHYGKLDSDNFAATMKEGEKWWIISGHSKSRTYKLRKPGWDEASALITRLRGAP